MKQAQLKSIFALIFLFIMSAILIHALSTTLESPVDNFADDDGYLDFEASCTPTAFDGTTSYNVTNATLWDNTGGTWAARSTIHVVEDGGPINNVNTTYFFNFTTATG